MIEASSQAEEDNLLDNQVSELYRNSTATNFAIVAIAIFLAWILWPVADSSVLLAWCGYTFVVALIRTLITLRYLNAEAPSANLKLWRNLHSAGVFLSGLGWGAVILFIVPVEARFHLVSAIFVISGLVTASAGSLASLKHGFAIFSIPALLPGALKLILLNQAETVLIGLFICAYLIFISMVALRIHKVILYSLRTQFESAKLVVVVQEENAALSAQYTSLMSQLEAGQQKIRELQAALDQKNADYNVVAEAAERRLKGDKFNVLLDKLHGGTWDYNLNTGEIRFSTQWLNMLGYKEDDVYPSMDFWQSLLHPDEKAEVLESLNSHVNGKLPEYFSSHRLRSRSGEWKWVFSRGQPVVWGTFGEVLKMVCVEIDIENPEIHLAGKLNSAKFKASDWLYSEPMFMQRLQYALRTTSIENVTHALCHIYVYPPAGQNAVPGDEVAKQVANILIRECRHQDPVLDLGNNSFVVLLENLAIDKATNKAAALQKAINSQQFGSAAQRYSINSSIGVTPIFDAHMTIAEIFEDAETACNIAASDAPDNIFVFQRGNEEFAMSSVEQRIIAKVKELLASKRLHLAASSLKALVSPAANTDKVAWLTATLPGLKNYPIELTDLQDQAETNSLATAFNVCTIEIFHDWAMAQPKSYTEFQHVFIYECKAPSIFDDNFIARVAQLFARSIPQRYFLCLAITESIFVAHSDRVRLLIDALKPAGIKFALINFGVGSFSYDYLKNLPVDYLEFDTALVANIDTDKTSLLTMKYFNEIGLALNFKTIGACSGSELQLAALHKIGTHFIRSSVADSHRLDSTHSSAFTKPVMTTGHDLSPLISLQE